MWSKLAKFILQYRLLLLLGIALLTLWMGYVGRSASVAYSLAKIVPDDHPKYIENQQFKEKFGEAGNVLFVGVETERFFQLDFFNAWYDLGTKYKTIHGVDGVLSLAHVSELQKDTVQKKLTIQSVLTEKPDSQADLDSLKLDLLGLPFYKNILYDANEQTFIMAININNEVINSDTRVEMLENILAASKDFEVAQATKLRHSGAPYLRALRAEEVKTEMFLFMLLSVIVAAILLLILFRSFQAMIFPIVIVLGGIAWTLGTIVLLGFQITMLTGLIPPLIVVISVPNCVYLLNRYHQEIRKHGHKRQALEKTIERIAYVIFYANLTTAIGFSVFSLMRSDTLREFGIVAGINIAVLFVTSIIILPVILSFLPKPKENQLKHLDNNWVSGIIERFSYLVFHRTKTIQGFTLVILILAVIGVAQLESRSYVFDNVSRRSPEYKDLKFFEDRFNGVIPFDILVDTQKPKRATSLGVLKKVEKVQNVLKEDSTFARPMSLVEGFKFAKQAFYNNKEQFYELPSSREKNFILPYLKDAGSGKQESSLLNSFTDSTQQIIRISTQMADVGTHFMPQILSDLEKKVNEILDTSRYKVSYAGSAIMSFVGNDILVRGLRNSVLLAFILIAIVIAFIFRTPKMLLLALIPNIIPLTITAALMGYFQIYLKPATVLIFSVALGISVDFTIHFLAKYRQELQGNGQHTENAIRTALNETGWSMLYTAVILFFGFIIFTASTFEGTFYLGVLTSVTIVIAILANLVLLPSILLHFDQKK